MRVRLHNESSDEPQFVPGIGVMTPDEWVELDDAQVEEFKAIHGFEVSPTNNLEVEGMSWPPEEPETDVVVEEDSEEEG